MLDYYARRAREYEDVYARPERRADLETIRVCLREALSGHDVLEVACGTGYWTRRIAPVVRSVVAVDAVDEVLEIARGHRYPEGRVRFVRCDAYDLSPVAAGCTAALAGFWWSHVPRRRRHEFLSSLHSRLAPGAPVVMMDNRYVEGSSTPIHRTDADGDTYQRRRLRDGSTHELLKNFATRADLEASLAPSADRLLLTELEYYWIARYDVSGR